MNNMSFEIYEVRPLDLSARRILSLEPLDLSERSHQEAVTPALAAVSTAAPDSDDDLFIDVETVDDDVPPFEVVLNQGRADATVEVIEADPDRFSIEDALDIIERDLNSGLDSATHYFGGRFTLDEFTDVQSPVPGSSTEPTTGSQYTTGETTIQVNDNNEVECSETTVHVHEGPRDFLRKSTVDPILPNSFNRGDVHPGILQDFIQLPFTLARVKGLVRHLYNSEDRFKIWSVLRSRESWHFSVPGCEFIFKSEEESKGKKVYITIHYYFVKDCTFHLTAASSEALLGVGGIKPFLKKAKLSPKSNIADRPKVWMIKPGQFRPKKEKTVSKIVLIRKDLAT